MAFTAGSWFGHVSGCGGLRADDQPRAWLTFNPRGEVTHTFTAERGVIGGEVVPFFALFVDKVFTAKADEVVRFLTSFGLNASEARAVVDAVGTAP